MSFREKSEKSPKFLLEKPSVQPQPEDFLSRERKKTLELAGGLTKAVLKLRKWNLWQVCECAI